MLWYGKVRSRHLHYLEFWHSLNRCERSEVGLISDNDLWKELGQLRRKATAQEEQISRQEQIILMLNQGQGEGPSATTAPQLHQQHQQHYQQAAPAPPTRDPTKLSKLGEED